VKEDWDRLEELRRPLILCDQNGVLVGPPLSESSPHVYISLSFVPEAIWRQPTVTTACRYETYFEPIEWRALVSVFMILTVDGDPCPRVASPFKRGAEVVGISSRKGVFLRDAN
jgi:hypothetical protein